MTGPEASDGNRARASLGALLLCAVVGLAVLATAGVVATGAQETASLDVDGPTVASADQNVSVTYTVTNKNDTEEDLGLGTQSPDEWDIQANTSEHGTWHDERNVTFSNVAPGKTREATITYKADSLEQSLYLFNASIIDRGSGPLTRVDNATHPVAVPGNAVSERAALPLRADTSDAETVVENQDIYVNPADDAPGSANRDELAVFGAGEKITMSLTNVTGANLEEYKKEDVRILVGHVDEQPDTGDVSTSMLPRSVADLQEMLTTENASRINENVDFTRPSDSQVTLDEYGEGEFSIDADDPGQYGVIVVEGEKLFDVSDDGNVSPAGPSDGTVIGAEGVAVQSDASKVTAPETIEPGDDATFEAGTELSDNVSHSVVLYHEDSFTSSRTTVNLTEEFTRDLSTDDVIVEHDITELNGVADAEFNASGFGYALGPEQASGSVLVSDIVSSVANESRLDESQLKRSDSITLDGSVIAEADADSDADLVVPTFGNWTEGEYTYVHVASEQDNTQSFETDTGTISVKESKDDDGDDDSGGGYVPPSDGDDGELSYEDVEISADSVAPGETFDVSVSVSNSGDSVVSRSLELLANDATLDSELVYLESGETDRITFEGSLSSEGSYDLSIDGTTLGTIDVAEDQPPAGEPSIEVTSASLSSSAVSTGESVTVTGTVENTGDADGDATVALVVDGETVDEQDVTVSAGESTDVEFTRTFDEAGDYEIQVGDAGAGTLEVTSDDDDDDGDDGSDDSGPGTIVVVLVGGIGITVAAVVGYLYHVGELEAVIEAVQQRFN